MTTWVRRHWLALPILAASLWLTFQYRWVLDDAFIYFRYAENLVGGAGLVFNRGEYVEGFTSPLWMMLVGLYRHTGFELWPFVLGFGLVSSVGYWYLVVRVNTALLPRDYTGPVLHLPAALLCLNYAVLSHMTSGLETALVQVCAAAFVLLIIEPNNRWCQLLVALAPLVRPELTLVWGLASAWCLWRVRRVPVVLVGVAVPAGLSWLLFRIWYYADLLPNTFYLKDGANWARGWAYLVDTVQAYHVHLWLVAGVGGLLVLRFWLRLGADLPKRMFALLSAACVTVYVVRVGGDFVHYRYLAFPLTVVLLSLGGVAEALLGWRPARARVVGPVVVALACLVTVSAFPRNLLPAHPLTLPRWSVPLLQAISSYRVRGIEDAAAHRSARALGPATWDGPPRTIRLRYRWGVVDGWCRTSFRYINTYLVHRFGLTDRVLARVPGRSTHHAGHNTLLPYALDLLKKRSIHTGHLYREAFVYMPRGVRHIWPTDGLDAWSPEWLKVNRREIDVLEAQNRNDHRFLPNLALAMTRVSFDPASTHSGRQPLNRPPVQSDEAEGDAEMGDPGGISTAVPVEPWSAPMVMDE